VSGFDPEAGKAIGKAFAEGYVAGRLRQQHSARCDAKVGDWKGEVCNLTPRSCDCWCHLDEVASP
jgi:hypothetical protein